MLQGDWKVREPTVSDSLTGFALPSLERLDGYSISVMKIAGLAAVELWIMLRIVLPTLLTSSTAPRSCGLVGPDSGLGVNRMFP